MLFCGAAGTGCSFDGSALDRRDAAVRDVAGDVPGDLAARDGNQDRSPADSRRDGADLSTSDRTLTDLPRTELPSGDLAPDLLSPDLIPADTLNVDGFNCPTACNGGCAGGVCRIDCSGAGDCICPPGMPCRAECAYGECAKVDCSAATDCEILCSPTFGTACTGDVRCGSGNCTVKCGNDACRGKVDCSAAKTCDIECAWGIATKACVGAVSCGSGPCTVKCGSESCRSKVDCSAASRCDLTCGNALALGACRADVTCGSGPCNVSCGGDSCRAKVICSASCSCSVGCTALLGNCALDRTCPGACAGGCAPQDGCNINCP